MVKHIQRQDLWKLIFLNIWQMFAIHDDFSKMWQKQQKMEKVLVWLKKQYMYAGEYQDESSVNFWMSQKLKYQANWKNCQNAKGYPHLGSPNP